MSTFANLLKTSSQNSTENYWQPEEYQKRALKLMVERGAAGVLLDPGMGKTAISLAAFKLLKDAKQVDYLMVIAPLRPLYVSWPKELGKWQNFTGLTYQILHGPEKEQRLKKQADIYLINPEGLEWLSTVCKQWAKGKRVMLVVDESTKFRNTRTNRFKFLKSILDCFCRRYILTGTPTPNGLEGLFGQIYMLDHGAALGRYITHFRNEYFYPSGYGGYEYTPQRDAEERITAKIAPFTVRLNAEDYIKLPRIMRNPIKIQLPKEARRVYNTLRDEFIVQLASGADITAPNVAASLIKLRQIANGFLYLPGNEEAENLHEEKLEALGDLLEQLQGQPVLIAYPFIEDLRRIQKRFPDIPSLSGDPRKASDLVKAFASGAMPALLAHPASAGHGIDGLQEGNCGHICWYGLTYDLEHIDQFNMRIRRRGNNSETVSLHYLMAEDTVDEAMLQATDSKDRDQKGFLSRLSAAILEQQT